MTGGNQVWFESAGGTEEWRLLHTLAKAVSGALVGASPASAMEDIASADAEAALAVHSDPERFLEIYQRYYGRILNYLYRRTGDRELALDLTSKTFVAALYDLRQHRREELRVRPWLYRVATNSHLDHCRARSRWMERIPIVGALWQLQAPAPPDERLVRESEPERVRAALTSLRPSHQTVLALRFYEDLSYAEIAAVLGVFRGSVRSRVSRALKALRRELERGGLA